MTRKRVLFRGLIGAPIGITVGYGINVILSLLWGGGAFFPVIPAFALAVGSDAVAAAIQFVLTAVLGSVFAMASCIWEADRWSLLRQTLLHFLIVAPTMLAVAAVCRWAYYTPGGLWGYLIIFLVIYAVIYAANFLSTRRKVAAANRRLGTER